MSPFLRGRWQWREVRVTVSIVESSDWRGSAFLSQWKLLWNGVLGINLLLHLTFHWWVNLFCNSSTLIHLREHFLFQKTTFFFPKKKKKKKLFVCHCRLRDVVSIDQTVYLLLRKKHIFQQVHKKQKKENQFRLEKGAYENIHWLEWLHWTHGIEQLLCQRRSKDCGFSFVRHMLDGRQKMALIWPVHISFFQSMFGVVILLHEPLLNFVQTNFFLKYHWCHISVYKDKMMRNSRNIWHFLCRVGLRLVSGTPSIERHIVDGCFVWHEPSV